MTKVLKVPMSKLATLDQWIDDQLTQPAAAGYQLVSSFSTPAVLGDDGKNIEPLIVLIFQKP